MEKTLSVVIVTRDRPKELVHCLRALLNQSMAPDEIVVIDNSTQKKTHGVVASLVRESRVPILMHHTQKQGYPALYNWGLHLANSEYVAYIDDDCVASEEWVAVIKQWAARGESEVCVGRSETFFPGNAVALASVLLDQSWKAWGRKGKAIHDFEVLDTKNIVFDANFLREKKLFFDEKRHVDNGSAQDSDFGMQIREHAGRAVYEPRMMVWHKDHRRVSDFLRRQWLRTQGHQEFERRWRIQRREKHLSFLKKLQVLRATAKQVFVREKTPLRKQITVWLLLIFAFCVRCLSRGWRRVREGLL